MMRVTLGPTRNHLTTGDVALCGADVRGRLTVELEPGADFSAHKDDCVRCAIIIKETINGGAR